MAASMRLYDLQAQEEGAPEDPVAFYVRYSKSEVMAVAVTKFAFLGCRLCGGGSFRGFGLQIDIYI